MEPTRLTALLKERAHEEGFDAVGIASARTLGRDGAALISWLREGRQASMEWMNRRPELRVDPRRVLPGCSSVVALAMNYWPGEAAARAPAGHAGVALYARGRDYHRVMGSRLKRLAAWLEETGGGSARGFVDTGPLLERAWAEQSGIGWIGKNANLLNRTLGSWMLLGEILTTVKLEPDQGPHADSCGSCTACIEACPTGAIVADGVVDSNLCIAYWTIEHRGPIPSQTRAGMEDWIFGCDLCQEVCPWNRRFARSTTGDPFRLRGDLQGLDPERILAMDESAFRESFSGTALMRARWDGMRRNACLILGTRGDPRGLAALGRVLDDPDGLIRSHAAWAIRRIGGPVAVRMLDRALERETESWVADEIRGDLAR